MAAMHQTMQMNHATHRGMRQEVDLTMEAHVSNGADAIVSVFSLAGPHSDPLASKQFMHWTEPATADDSRAVLEQKLWDPANPLWSGADLTTSGYAILESRTFASLLKTMASIDLRCSGGLRPSYFTILPCGGAGDFSSSPPVKMQHGPSGPHSNPSYQTSPVISAHPRHPKSRLENPANRRTRLQKFLVE